MSLRVQTILYISIAAFYPLIRFQSLLIQIKQDDKLKGSTIATVRRPKAVN